MPSRNGLSRQTFDAVMATPVGRIGIVIENEALVDIRFLGPAHAVCAPRSKLARKTCRQLQSYFLNPAYPFRIPLKLTGTNFQLRVWRALQRIPSGETRSYGQLARTLKTSPRAVGNACRANPIVLVVPCHRVVATNGMGGFMGKRSGTPLDMKNWLLEHEQHR